MDVRKKERCRKKKKIRRKRIIPENATTSSFRC
jgi:hypothetical protein